MRLFTPVAIVHDHTMAHVASALRGVLEAFHLRVDYYRMVQLRQVQSFFASPSPFYEYMVILAHGSGEMKEDMHIAFEVGDQKDGKYEEPEGWELVTYKLTPAEIAKSARRPGGALLSLACGSGREPLARAFLERGFRAYIGPETTYYNTASGLLFFINFFYHLTSETRDYCTVIRSERAAFELAAGTDPGFDCGPSVFRYYEG